MNDRGEFRSWFSSILDDPDFGNMEGDVFKLLFALKHTLGAKGIGVVRPTTLCDQLKCDAVQLDRLFRALEAPKSDSDRGWIEYDRTRNIVWLINGLKYEPSISPTHPKHTKFIRESIKPLGERPIVRHFKAYYSAWFGEPIDSLSDGYRKPIEGVSDHKRQATATTTNTTTSDSDKNPLTTRDRFFAKFYDRATPTRKAEVKQQLDQALTPDGVAISRGVVVKARNEAHLNRCISEVLQGKPPNDPDKAIVFVLKKLADPVLDAQRRTVTEAASESHKRDGRKFDLYVEAQREAAKVWSKDHADELAELERQALEKFPSDAPLAGEFRKRWVREQICDTAGFPMFEEWRQQLEVSAA